MKNEGIHFQALILHLFSFHSMNLKSFHSQMYSSTLNFQKMNLVILKRQSHLKKLLFQKKVQCVKLSFISNCDIIHSRKAYCINMNGVMYQLYHFDITFVMLVKLWTYSGVVFVIHWSLYHNTKCHYSQQVKENVWWSCHLRVCSPIPCISYYHHLLLNIFLFIFDENHSLQYSMVLQAKWNPRKY